MTEKVLYVKLPDAEHSVIKAYAAWTGVTMSDLATELTLLSIQKAAICCRHTKALLEEHGVEPDPRAPKPCCDSVCLVCEHNEACKAGTYPGYLVLKKQYRQLLNEGFEAMGELDGTSFPGAPTLSTLT